MTTPDFDPRPDAPGTPPDDRLERMTAAGYRYGFFQAVRLLAARRGGARSVGGPSYRGEAVRVQPDPANVFPAADVRHITPRDGRPTTVDVGFGGLYGVDAALPGVFHERISSGAPDTRPLRDFLDLFGHRSYAQLWRAWAKYRPDVRTTGEPDVHATRAAALSGVPASDDAPVPLADLLPLASRLSAWTRNAEGLRALLEHATGLAVRVFENIPRLVHLADRPRLGSARLGVDSVIGARIYDESGKFRIEIGPLGGPAFRSLLPGREGAARVAALVRLYVSDMLDYDVDLLLHTSEVPPLVLGDGDSATLGRNATLGTPSTPLVRRRVRYVPA